MINIVKQRKKYCETVMKNTMKQCGKDCEPAMRKYYETAPKVL
jgi:hypothetical protein